MASYAESTDSTAFPESLLDKGKRCLRLAMDAWSEQRKREREDLLFQVAENQWSDEAKKMRKGRPMLSISLLRQPQALVKNQAANAKLGLNLQPVSEDANEELAETKQGLYRRIERDGLADQARLWALAHAIQCGLGWYRVNTQWDEDGDDPLDQEIVFERILHQSSIYMDPAAQKPDFSDAEWCFVVTRMQADKFAREFPGAEMATPGFDFEGAAEEEPEWVALDTERPSVVVAEYFYKVHKLEDITHRGRKRTKDRVTVRRALLTAVEVLEDEEWNGRYIPIIPVIGDELQPIDGKRRWEGMVRPARDGQITFNYSISSMVEDVGRLSKAPYIAVEGSFEGHEEQWKEANIKNLPYLEYKPLSIAGTPAPAPAPMQIDGTKMQLSAQLAELGKTLVQTATAIYDPSLGKDNPREKSGRAILALQQQADAGTSNYIQNLTGISMPYEARVVLDLMPTIYDRPGRITRVLGGEDETKAVMLNRPFVMDAQGRPVAARPGQPGAKEFNLSQGKYSIATSAGKSFQTRLEQGATEMGEILAGAPDLMPIIGDLYFKFRDFPGAKEISERLAKWREKQFPGLGDEKDGQMTVEQAQMKAQALEQQLQQAMQQLQLAMQEIKTEQAKQQAMIAKAQMDNEAKVMVEQIRQQGQVKEDALKMMLEKMEQRFEAMQNMLNRQQELLIHREEMAHEVAMADASGRSATFRREGGREEGREREDERSQGGSSSSEESGESGFDAQPQGGE